eukprot:symbB.v1.2.011048.t1/scaffold736.1/size167634/1
MFFLGCRQIRQEVADPLVEQGLQLLDPDIMKAVLWVPCSTGLRHGSSLNCPFLLGHEVSTSTESCQVALLPKEDHPAKAFSDAISWERFLIFALKSKCLWPHLEPKEARQLARKLLDPDWWILVQAVNPMKELLEYHHPSLAALPYEEIWELRHCLSGDFSPFLQGVHLTNEKGSCAPAPIFPARAAQFIPLASDFLCGLGVTLCTSHRALIDRCLDPMLQALDQKSSTQEFTVL